MSLLEYKSVKRLRQTLVSYRIGPKPWTRILAEYAGKWYSLALLLVFVACAAGIVLYRIDSHAFLYFGDATSRVVKSREFIDSQHTGIGNIGTVWLPLPQLLLVPFVSINGLFYSGIAGAMVGIPCLVGTGLLLFGIIRRITRSLPIAFLGACLFALNPNVVYMALTPMSELSLFFFVALGGYALLRWLETDAMKWLLLSAVAVMLATLCRYEAWILAPFVSLVSASKGIGFLTESKRLSLKRIAGIAAISFAGIAFWLVWNAAEYGDSLTFLHWTSSIAPAVSNYSLEQRPLANLVTFGRAILTIFGPALLLVAAGVFIRFRHKAVEWKQVMLLMFFSLPPLFIFFALMAGRVHMDQWWWNWRFVLTLGMFLSLAAAMGLSELFSRVRSMPVRVAIIAALLMMPFAQITIPSVGVATFKDAAKSLVDTTPFATALGERLNSIDDKSSIALLTGYGQAQRIMISSGLPLKRFHIICNPDSGGFLEPLWDSDRYVVVGIDRTLESQELIKHWLSQWSSKLKNYRIYHEDGNYMLLERREIFALGETK